MHIPFKEPVSPRYIHITPETNQVHLLVPVVGGQEISTDNTCKATAVLKKFFDGGVRRELAIYKKALEFDIALLEQDNPQRVLKEARLAQIEIYIEAVSAMQYSYREAMAAFIERPSNLYSIQLRPHDQDIQSNVVNPTFTIERSNDAQGNPLSALYNAMYALFPDIEISIPDPRTRLTNAVLEALPGLPAFADIQRVLKEQCAALFGLSIDFTQGTDSKPVTKEAMDTIMGFEGNATSQDYIDALLGACAPNMWENIQTPPFYSVGNISENLSPSEKRNAIEERTEQLSILTQFFLANLNVYCKAKNLSAENFGKVLDASPALSKQLVDTVSMALSKGDNLEEELCYFCNIQTKEFKLSRFLNTEDITAVKQKFERTYYTVTATKENPHMDDFMILDMEATGKIAKFVTHQGAICVNFAEIVEPTLPNQNYFAQARKNFAIHSTEIQHENKWIAGELEIKPEALLARINNDQLEKLPEPVQEELRRTSPALHLYLFLHDVAKGRQEKAEALLRASETHAQMLIRTPGLFTDYSGRTFHCTAYEYAYWAKDTHMCRMLERRMDEETKAYLLERIDDMERTGLTYQQHGKEHCSVHFDFAPLKTALQKSIDVYEELYGTDNYWDAILEAWMGIGKAQRDIPAHVAQEYCRADRSFDPLPQFNEETLPRILAFFNFNTRADDSWFPLKSAHFGLGFDIALTRGSSFGIANNLQYGIRGMAIGCQRLVPSYIPIDLAAIIRLDEVRTADLMQSRDNLSLPVNLQKIKI
ncbi:hypothetical protein EP47_06870 [Legionella norrlandica]|uniref:SidC N-terminal domain-containing protein n=2 Tax=Legionella norrlandica TaxID=1498499 RepID=A0A0A2T6Y1_9GAMM|nr:hypothetical protein EP47_06870 [Legionella norrlandica]